MRSPARAGRRTRGTGSAAGRRTRFPRPKASTPPVRQTETIAARTRVTPGSRAREGRTTASLSELPTSRVRAPRQASPPSPAARSADRTSTCGRDVRLGSRTERTPPPRGPPPTKVRPRDPLKYYPPRTGSLATTPRRRRLALTAPTLRTTGARMALPPTRAGRGAGTATGQSPALAAKTAASPPLRSSSRTTASDSPTAKGGLEPGCPCRRQTRAQNPSAGWYRSSPIPRPPTRSRLSDKRSLRTSRRQCLGFHGACGQRWASATARTADVAIRAWRKPVQRTSDS
jgi:hypothetical protein